MWIFWCWSTWSFVIISPLIIFLVEYATITYFGVQIMQMAGFTLRVETFGIPLIFNNVA